MTITVYVRNGDSSRSVSVKQSGNGYPENVLPPGAEQEFTVHRGNTLEVLEADEATEKRAGYTQQDDDQAHTSGETRAAHSPDANRGAHPVGAQSTGDANKNDVGPNSQGQR